MKKPTINDDDPAYEPERPDYRELFPDDAALVARLEQDAKWVDALRLLGCLSTTQLIEAGLVLGIPPDEIWQYVDILHGDVEIPPEAVRCFSGTV